MRPRVGRVLAVLLVLLLAGCSSPGGDGDEPPATTTPGGAPPATTPTVTAEPTADPTPTPTTATPTPTTETPLATPTPPATVPVNITLRHDYSNASENLTFSIPPNAEGNLTIRVQFDTAPTAVPGQYLCTAGLRIKVIRPDGSLHLDVVSAAGNGQNVHCGVVSASTGASYATDVPPGTWHASFEGAGVGIGWVFVRPTPSE